jgi:GNAT superfamily N-acetyltransferase
MSQVRLATTDADIARCFDVMRQLRTHLCESVFLAQVKRQQAEQNWHLAYVEEAGVVAAVAGFRFLECLSSGPTLYVDDLVTGEDLRSQGYGEILMAWLENHARASGCETLSLDSGTQRTGAHKFYFRAGLVVTSFHFAKKL